MEWTPSFKRHRSAKRRRKQIAGDGDKRSFVQRGLIDAQGAKEMNEREHGGGSKDASVRIDGEDRSGLERFSPLRPATVCHGGAAPARPGSFALPLSQTAAGRHHADLLLRPLELIDGIAAWVALPRKHRLRYFGVFAPNSLLREFITAMVRSDSGATSTESVAGAVAAIGSSARYAWAVLIARIVEVFPLLCLHCGGRVRFNRVHYRRRRR